MTDVFSWFWQEVSSWDLRKRIEVSRDVMVIGAFVLGAVQFWLSQRLQRARSVDELLEKLHKDEDIKTAWRFIDSEDRWISIPVKYGKDGKERFDFYHSVQKMSEAMSLKSRGVSRETGIPDLLPVLRTPDNLLYVDIFDKFFDFIAIINGYRKGWIVSVDRLTSILYILQRLDELKYREEKIFEGYLRLYEYGGVIEMIEVAKRHKRLWNVKLLEGREFGVDSVEPTGDT